MKNNKLTQLQTQLSAFGIRSASAQASRKYISSNSQDLDEYFSGGLPIKSVVEWGAPLGKEGREVIIKWASAMTQEKKNVLWISSQDSIKVFPPAWQARSIDLNHMYFAHSLRPVVELKPVFLESVFKLVVLDSPKQLTSDDSAFIAIRARENQQLIMVIRNYFLNHDKGNVWAKLRINCWRDPIKGLMNLEAIKGLSAKRLSFCFGDSSLPSR